MDTARGFEYTTPGDENIVIAKNDLLQNKSRHFFQQGGGPSPVITSCKQDEITPLLGFISPYLEDHPI